LAFGRKVQDAQPLIKKELIDAGLAVVYSEPAETVISRSGDKCVCALTDQWYIAYGEPEWRAKVRPPPLSPLLLAVFGSSNAVLFV
jgi:leucyl-tRNA synthetase